MAATLLGTPQGSSSTSGNTCTISFTVASGNDRLLIGAAGWRDANSVTGMTFDGNAFSSIVEEDGSAGGNNRRSVALWSLSNPDVKTADFVATWSSNPEHGAAGILAFQDAGGVGTPDADHVLASSTTSLTVSPASTEDDLILDASFDSSLSGLAYGASQTERLLVDAASDLRLSTKAGAATSTAMSRSWSDSSARDIALAAVAIEPAAAGGNDRAAQISFAEFEAPDAPRAAQLSFAEFEVPFAPRAAQLSWAEFEVPLAPRAAQVSWAEFETPDIPARAAQVSFCEFQVPGIDAAAQVSWFELQVPDVGEFTTGYSMRNRKLIQLR